jgi:hypothetical protein
MKTVKNTSMQGIYVAFETPAGPLQKFIASKASIQVPDSWGGCAVDNMIRRRMLKVTHIADVPTPAPAPAPVKTTAPASKASKKTPKKSN